MSGIIRKQSNVFNGCIGKLSSDDTITGFPAQQVALVEESNNGLFTFSGGGIQITGPMSKIRYRVCCVLDTNATTGSIDISLRVNGSQVVEFKFYPNFIPVIIGTYELLYCEGILDVILNNDIDLYAENNTNGATVLKANQDVDTYLILEKVV